MGSERMHLSVVWELAHNCRAILCYLSKVMKTRGRPLMTEKGQILPSSAKMQKDRSGKPQSSQSYFSTWENYGTDPYGNYFQVHKGQDGDWKSQVGFTKDKSCLINLNTFSDEATWSVNGMRGELWMSSSLTLARHLTSVSFNILADKLLRYGLENWTTRW